MKGPRLSLEDVQDLVRIRLYVYEELEEVALESGKRDAGYMQRVHAERETYRDLLARVLRAENESTAMEIVRAVLREKIARHEALSYGLECIEASPGRVRETMRRDLAAAGYRTPPSDMWVIGDVRAEKAARFFRRLARETPS
jgi:hypothetical protein